MAVRKDAPAVAADFDAIIAKDRRARNATLAQQMLGRGKGKRAPPAPTRSKSGAGLSLADRITSNKSSAKNSPIINRTQFKATKPKRTQRPNPPPIKGDVDADWTHDLHDMPTNGNANENASNSSAPRANQRLSRAPRSNGDNYSSGDNGAALLQAQRAAITKEFPVAPKSNGISGMSIRGLAGPYTIIAENFALGTTAEDIQSAMAPIGGTILKCVVHPMTPVTAEITFESKEGADNVIEQFHGQMADGLLLSLFHKVAVAALRQPTPVVTPTIAPTGPRADTRNPTRETDHYEPSRDRASARRGNDNRRSDERNNGRDAAVDSSYGFGNEMDVDQQESTRPLYSDNMGRRNGGGRREDRGGDRWESRDQNRRYR